jgi:protein-serine/threonine kinase
LIGYPPFSGSSPAEIFQNILHTNYTISWDEFCDDDISPQAADLVKKLLCDADTRLGTNGIEEVKQHPFFEGINWDTLRKRPPPFKPNPADIFDTKFFEGVFW